jgi:tetratricopeptide (TPR) repeat protein
MSVVIVPLKQIILDPANPIDLTTLAEVDAIRLIKDSYGFLSSTLDVSIRDGLAVIELKEEHAKRASEAQKDYLKGVKEAQHGNYQKAVKLFSKMLEVVPQHVDARRNLAMAHLEMGQHQQAKTLLEECLKLDPTNAWSFVLIGNIYAKHERNRPVAEFYYEAGLASSPDDNILLNNYAALQMEQGNVAKAKELFERALQADPHYPNSHYGLALLHQSTGNLPAALTVLERLFALPLSADIRSGQVLQVARELYLGLNRKLATEEEAGLMDGVLARKAALEKTTGYPITIEEDATLEQVSATARMAWKHGLDEHRVRYRRRPDAVTPHLVAHELQHIVLEHEARRAGRNRAFITTGATKERAMRALDDHPAKLQRMGYNPAKATDLMDGLFKGLCNQLFNCPLDMVVEYNLHHNHPELRHAQFVSLHQQHQDALQVLASTEIKRVTPPLIFRANLTLSAAYSLFIDHLYPGRTDYAAAWRSSEVLSTSRSLFQLWRKRMDSFAPGDEYDLVDEFALQLKLRPWFDWQADAVPLTSAAHPAATKPLTTAQPEAYTFCLDALSRFTCQSRDQIFSVISEISLLGANGIDHTNPVKTYTLKTCPGEVFTGLHLLCLMFVGFKLYDPKIDCGLDFGEVYELARDGFGAVVH